MGTTLHHKVNDHELRVLPETGGAFRITYARDISGVPDAVSNVDPSRKSETARKARGGIATKAGTVCVSGKNQSLMLRTVDGDPLLTVKPEGEFICLRSHRKGACYGGGDAGQEAFPGSKVKDKAPRLTKTTLIRSFAGNGVSVVPFIWHSSGWALLVLAEDDAAEIRPIGKAGQSFRVRNNRRLTDFVLMPAANLSQALRWLADIGGHAPVPPRWALGFMHSRWGYKSYEEIRDTWIEFRARMHPVDTFIYDFEWYTPKPDYSLRRRGRRDYEDFGWNTKIFFDPREQFSEARALNIRAVGIRKPRLGNLNLLDRVRERGWHLTSWDRKMDDNMSIRTLDFRKQAVRDWYWERNKPLMEQGMDGWWNDEGEQFPSLYYWWNRAQRDGQDRDFPNTRFWSTNRAYTIGLARTGASVWTGDSKSGWKDLRKECLKMLNGGLSGMPWITCDLGGFYGNPEPELMVRYMQMGVFFPIMRTHSCSGAKARTPWNYGEEAETAIRSALEWRYRLLPYTNSLAHETNRTGLPLARPMMLEFPERKLQDVWEQWMYGPSILAAPILDEGGRRKVILPRGYTWYDLETGVAVRGGCELGVECLLGEVPAWQRSGSILPLSPVIQHSGDLDEQELQIRVATGSNASFEMVEDDGVTLECERGGRLTTKWIWNERTGRLSTKVSGSYADLPKSRSFEIRLYGRSDVSSVVLNGKTLRGRKESRNRAQGWMVREDGSVSIFTGKIPATRPLTLKLAR